LTPWGTGRIVSGTYQPLYLIEKECVIFRQFLGFSHMFKFSGGGGTSSGCSTPGSSLDQLGSQKIFWFSFEPLGYRPNSFGDVPVIVSYRKREVDFSSIFGIFPNFQIFRGGGGGHQVVAQHLGPAQIAIVFAFDPFMDRFRCFGLLLESVFPCKTPKNTQNHLPPKRTGECINNTFITSSGLKR